MRSNIRGILVFLLAFLLGTAAVPPRERLLDVPPISDERIVNHVLTEEPVGYGTGSASSRPGGGADEPRPSVEEFKRLVTCRDKTIALVWDELKRTEEFWEWVNPSYKNTDCGGMYEAYRLDLNDDGVDEIRIRGQNGNHCGATGNCLEWIFQRVGGKKYKPINHYSAEHFHLRKTRTSGFRDIYVTTHDSASASYHRMFRYADGRYAEAKCWYTERHLDGSVTNLSCAEWSKQFAN